MELDRQNETADYVFADGRKITVDYQVVRAFVVQKDEWDHRDEWDAVAPELKFTMNGRYTQPSNNGKRIRFGGYIQHVQLSKTMVPKVIEIVRYELRGLVRVELVGEDSGEVQSTGNEDGRDSETGSAEQSTVNSMFQGSGESLLTESVQTGATST